MSTKGLGNRAYLSLCEAFWELYLEENEQISVLEGVLMERETLLFNSHERVRLDDLARFALNADHLTVEVLDGKVDSSQGLKKCDFLLHEDIGTLALEDRMRLLVHHEYDIACFTVRILIGLAMEHVLLAMRGSLIDLGREHLTLLDDFLTIANIALVFISNNLSSAIAFVARASRLTVHAWTEHRHSCPHATTLAVRAS